MLRLQQLERRLDDRKLQAEPARQLGAGQLAGEVQRLQHELQDQVEREPGSSSVCGASGNGTTSR